MNRIPVFFRPELVAPDQGASPSAHKPAQVVADWQAQGLPIEVIAPPPVTRSQLALAHDGAYVDGVLDCQEQNGFGNCSPTVTATLPYTSGAMLAAARRALANRRVAVAPVSGFHHAALNYGGGYCTVRADPNLSHRADRNLSQGWKPTLGRSAVDKCRSLRCLFASSVVC